MWGLNTIILIQTQVPEQGNDSKRLSREWHATKACKGRKNAGEERGRILLTQSLAESLGYFLKSSRPPFSPLPPTRPSGKPPFCPKSWLTLRPCFSLKVNQERIAKMLNRYKHQWSMCVSVSAASALGSKYLSLLLSVLIRETQMSQCSQKSMCVLGRGNPINAEQGPLIWAFSWLEGPKYTPYIISAALRWAQ